MGRANRAEVIDSIRRRTGLPATVVRTVYDAFFDEVVNQVTMGNSVMLTGFGKFYPLSKAGHSVQFKRGSGGDYIDGRVDDYQVLKFSASHRLNQRITQGLRT